MCPLRLRDDGRAEEGRYVYYRCTGFKGACGNTYIREERLADLLGDCHQADPDRAGDRGGSPSRNADDGRRCRARARRITAAARTPTQDVVSKLDRGYEDYVAGRITEEFWTPEIRGVGGRAADCRGRTGSAATPATTRQRHNGAKDFRTRETGRISLQIAGSDRTAPIARNGAIELHVRSRNSLSHLHFAVRPVGARERNWKLAERVGFEPTCRLRDKTLSRRPRYDHFGTSPLRQDRFEQKFDYSGVVVATATGKRSPLPTPRGCRPSARHTTHRACRISSIDARCPTRTCAPAREVRCATAPRCSTDERLLLPGLSVRAAGSRDLV